MTFLPGNGGRTPSESSEFDCAKLIITPPRCRVCGLATGENFLNE